MSARLAGRGRLSGLADGKQTRASRSLLAWRVFRLVVGLDRWNRVGAVHLPRMGARRGAGRIGCHRGRPRLRWFGIGRASSWPSPLGPGHDDARASLRRLRGVGFVGPGEGWRRLDGLGCFCRRVHRGAGNVIVGVGRRSSAFRLRTRGPRLGLEMRGALRGLARRPSRSNSRRFLAAAWGNLDEMEGPKSERERASRRDQQERHRGEPARRPGVRRNDDRGERRFEGRERGSRACVLRIGKRRALFHPEKELVDHLGNFGGGRRPATAPVDEASMQELAQLEGDVLVELRQAFEHQHVQGLVAPRLEHVVDVLRTQHVRHQGSPRAKIVSNGGYVMQIEHPGLAPGLVYARPPYLEDTSVSVVAFTTEQLDSVISGLGVAPDPGLGHIFLTAVDCQRAPAKGVSFSASPTFETSRPFYIVGGFLAGGSSRTDASGQGGYVNMPTMFIELSAMLGEESLGDQERVAVRAGTISYVQVAPDSLTPDR